MKKRTVRWLRAALMAVLVLSMAASAALASSTSVRINTSTKIYQSPSKSARSADVPESMKVTLVSTSNGWGEITHKGQKAYIPLKYLTLVDPVKVYVTASAKVYSAPGSGKLGTVSTGTMLYFLGLDGDYAHVENSERSAVGYVKLANLSKTKPSNTVTSHTSGYSGGSTSSSGVYYGNNGSTSSLAKLPSRLLSTTTSPSVSKIEYTIFVALSQIGKPYSTHSSPPKSFDCAKFCYYCYGKSRSGLLKSSSKSQGYDTRFQKISSISALKRGDMVCFDTASDSDLCDHTGIYLGGGWFIHASSQARMVIISRMDSGYYKRTFSWGRRIFAS